MTAVTTETRGVSLFKRHVTVSHVVSGRHSDLELPRFMGTPPVAEPAPYERQGPVDVASPMGMQPPGTQVFASKNQISATRTSIFSSLSLCHFRGFRQTLLSVKRLAFQPPLSPILNLGL